MTIYEAVSGPDAPKHIFNDDGVCIRCGEDAEEWEAGCVEELLIAAHAQGWDECVEACAGAVCVVCRDYQAGIFKRNITFGAAEFFNGEYKHKVSYIDGGVFWEVCKAAAIRALKDGPK